MRHSHRTTSLLCVMCGCKKKKDEQARGYEGRMCLTVDAPSPGKESAIGDLSRGFFREDLLSLETFSKYRR